MTILDPAVATCWQGIQEVAAGGSAYQGPGHVHRGARHHHLAGALPNIRKPLANFKHTYLAQGIP